MNMFRGNLVNYNFDEIIDRRYTNAMNVEGYKGYLLVIQIRQI